MKNYNLKAVFETLFCLSIIVLLAASVSLLAFILIGGLQVR